MSADASEYERLLREAVEKAKEKAPRASDDLFQQASDAMRAVAAVTKGVGVLELVPVTADDPPPETYQLILRKGGSDAPPTDLGVYRLAATGYPVLRWPTRWTWEQQPDDSKERYLNAGELRAHFRWLVSNPESRLVVLAGFLQQLQAASAGRG